jgi:ABC-2 type transport system permease protein
MKALAASYRNEWDKLMRRKKYIVFLCIAAALIILWALLMSLLSAFIQSNTYGGWSLNFTPTPMGTLPVFLFTFIPFLMFMGATDLITTEGAEHTMKASLYLPVERWKLYLAKILALVTYSALFLGTVYVITTALNQIMGRRLSIPELLIALASYASTLVPLLVLAAFASFISLIGRSSSLTMFLLIIIYLALMAITRVFPILHEMAFTSYLTWYRIWIGFLPGATKMIHMLVILFGWGAVFFLGGSLVFDRKEY